MENIRSPQFLDRNPITQRAHARQKLWQITIPMLVGIVLSLGLAVLAALAEAEGASRWADISLIFLLIPVMVISMLILTLFSALIYVMLRVLKLVPPFAHKARHIFAQVERRVRTGSNLAAEPVLRVQCWLAALRVLRREL